MRILLVAPPYRQPNEGALAIATLRPILEAAGHEVEELHGSPLYPPAPAVPWALFNYTSRYSFGRQLTGRSVDDYLTRVLDDILAEVDPHGVVSPERSGGFAGFGVDEAELREILRAGLVRAELCLERMRAHALALGAFDAVGFSAMFTDQLPPAILLARQLRADWPGTAMIFGGAACFEEQGDGLLASFPEIDVVCHTEGEEVILPIVEALAGRTRWADVPGVVWRDAGGPVHNPSPPLLRNLDVLPFPDYRGFVAQLAASEWAEQGPDLFFETSRGCWWGEKSLCTFCGLNNEGLAFRSKTPERAYDEIAALHRDYPGASSLRAADNILDFKYLKTLLPRLVPLASDAEHPLRLFYEVKSNMKPAEVELMAAAGIREVQPGIESFSDGVLKVMRKGCTALGQVQFVKWAHQAGIQPSYSMLVFNPGEEAAWYWDMVDLMGYLEHLLPPLSTVSMLLERFSPYHNNPDEFAITQVRPKPFFHDVLGDHADARLAYKFDYEHTMFADPAHLAAVRAVAKAVRRWRAGWRPDLAYFVDDGERLSIVDSRDGAEARGTIGGIAARIYLFLDQNRPRAQIATAFPGVSAEVLDALLLTWLHRRWVCRVEDRWLAVLPRKGPARMVAMAPPPPALVRERRLQVI